MSDGDLLLRQVRESLPSPLVAKYFDEEPWRGVHLAIMREPYLTMLLDGDKTIESRFSVNRVDPYDRVLPGDLILVKGGPVVGAFVAGDVDCRLIGAAGMAGVRDSHNNEIRASDQFWELKSEARFATLVRVEDPQKFSPFTVSKRDMRGWVVMRAHDRELVPTL